MTAVESRLATGQTCLCHGTALHGICLMEFAYVLAVDISPKEGKFHLLLSAQDEIITFMWRRAWHIIGTAAKNFSSSSRSIVHNHHAPPLPHPLLPSFH